MFSKIKSNNTILCEKAFFISLFFLILLIPTGGYAQDLNFELIKAAQAGDTPEGQRQLPAIRVLPAPGRASRHPHAVFDPVDAGIPGEGEKVGLVEFDEPEPA